jgi:hypothetical protein
MVVRRSAITAGPQRSPTLPGLRKVEVVGQIDGRSLCASQVFLATAGNVAGVSLKLA